MQRSMQGLATAVCLSIGTASAQQTPAPAGTTVIDRQAIAAVLRQALPEAPKEGGGGLYDGPDYRIGALRRGLPGEAGIHGRDTDILYILAGRATLVTGGTVRARHAISQNEERGAAISNGVRHDLHRGDLVVIPKGQPHWFQAITAEVSYLVIKVQ